MNPAGVVFLEKAEEPPSWAACRNEAVSLCPQVVLVRCREPAACFSVLPVLLLSSCPVFLIGFDSTWGTKAAAAMGHACVPTLLGAVCSSELLLPAGKCALTLCVDVWQEHWRVQDLINCSCICK